MKLYKSNWLFFLLVIITLWMGSCKDEPPEFPVIPKIEFESVDFKRGLIGSNNTPDTIIIKVRFQDGDGNLGLSNDDIVFPPYNPFDVQRKPNIDPCLFSDRFNTEDCPGLPPKFDCINYKLPPTYLGIDTINDTLYVKINENHNNFIVDLLRKENGQFEIFDFREELCVAPLSGRFSPLRENFSKSIPLEGVIEFKSPYSGFFTLFRNDTLKLRMRIKDRTLNNSNTVESCEFTLDELLETPDGECPPRP